MAEPNLAERFGGGPRLGRQWLELHACGSTNDEAMRLGRAGAAEGLVVTAAQQSGGRGRLGRSWHSPADDNLYLSVLLRPPLPPGRAPLLCLCAGLALYHAALATTARPLGVGPAADGGGLRLKWPNDLLALEPAASPSLPPLARKVGGILTELCLRSGQIDFVVVGIGCNLNSRDFPSELLATSLRCLLPGQPLLLRRAFAERLLSELADFYQRYLLDGAAPILDAFAAAAGLGEGHPEVLVATGSGPLRGVPLGLGADGELLLRTPSGALERVLSGDVMMASAAPH